jgi:pimeloyl-ACP methyl ester carboxylesterase
MIEMPPRQMIESNGITLALYEAGAPGPLPSLIFCHGFPELAFSWRHQLKGLAAKGFHVLAVDMRGYGWSDCPTAVEAYDMANLTADLVGVMDAKKIARAVFVGHDWGGLVVWQMPLRYPARVAGVIGVNTPYTKRPPIDPIELYRKRFGEDFYIVQFNASDASDRALGADVKKTMQATYRHPEAETGDGRAGLSMIDRINAYDPNTDKLQLLSEAELAVYVEAFTRTGFTPGINWYRNFSRNWTNEPDVADHVSQPSLMIMAAKDRVLPPAAADGMEKYVPNLTRYLVEDSGHHTQQEQPEEVNRVIAQWMRSTFG